MKDVTNEEWKRPCGPYAKDETFTVSYYVPKGSNPLDVGGVIGFIRAADGSRECLVQSSAVKGNIAGDTPQGLVVHVPAGYVFELRSCFGIIKDVKVTRVT